MNEEADRKLLPALKIQQWLKEWNDIEWQKSERRAEPPHWFYQFSIAANELRALSGVYPRTKDRKRASQDTGIQRSHDDERSKEIKRFVQYGYPWSNLSEAKRKSGDFKDLRQPGWLPTAIVVNILTENDERRGKQVAPSDLVHIEDRKNGTAELILPKLSDKWRPKGIPPIEVIDGQHRLWAFESSQTKSRFDLPVIAFVGLDLSWQAYLFYTINIKPTKINTSLAFDIYPLLRTEKWLAKFEGHVIYRETRAQELVDLLCSHPASPWYKRINMLGERGQKGLTVTQASWVRSLLASFIRSWKGSRVTVGGLFGSNIGQHQTVLSWSRLEQAAFLMVVGNEVQLAISKMKKPWMESLRGQQDQSLPLENKDPAFFGQHNLLNSDQGIRILLQSINDLCFVRAEEIGLQDWGGNQYGTETEDEQIKASISSLKRNKKLFSYLKHLSRTLASYDWRSSSCPGLSDEEKMLKATFRGSGGYRDLRINVLEHISNGKDEIAKAATDVKNLLNY